MVTKKFLTLVGFDASRNHLYYVHEIEYILLEEKRSEKKNFGSLTKDGWQILQTMGASFGMTSNTGRFPIIIAGTYLFVLI